MTEIVRFSIEGDHPNINTVIESAYPADMVIVRTESDHRCLVALSDNFLYLFIVGDGQKIHADYLSRAWGWSRRQRIERGKFCSDDLKDIDHFKYRVREVAVSDLPKVEAAYKAAEKWASECGRQRKWAKPNATPPAPAPKPNISPAARREVAEQIAAQLPASMVLIVAPEVPGGVVALSEKFLKRFKYAQDLMLGGEELGLNWGNKELSISIEGNHWRSHPRDFIGDLPVRVRIIEGSQVEAIVGEYQEALQWLRHQKRLHVRSWAELPE